MRNPVHPGLCLLLAIAVAACDRAPEQPAGPAAAAPAAAGPVAERDPYAAALAADRLERDRLRDAQRQPAEVLRFFGIEPGMRVLDVFAGGGYYSEILAHLLGPDGQVVMYNNAAYNRFAADEHLERFADGRLSAVQRLEQEVPALELPEASFDAALMVLAYHDVYYVNDAYGWPAIDPQRFLAEIHAALVPGGVLGVVDHAAAAGSGADAVQELHRIEREFLIADMQRAGFVLEAASELLANPDDDRSLPPFDEAVRGRTDRFVLRFRKPLPAEAG